MKKFVNLLHDTFHQFYLDVSLARGVIVEQTFRKFVFLKIVGFLKVSEIASIVNFQLFGVVSTCIIVLNKKLQHVLVTMLIVHAEVNKI